MKTDLSPTSSWRGLPLSPAQNREVLNYVRRCERAGLDPDTPELRSMIEDMLHPPELAEDGSDDIAHCTEDACFAATHEEPGERIDERD